MDIIPKQIGFIGLGLMGLPMATNLLKKLPPDTQFYVYDVNQASVDSFVKQEESRVHACENSKQVADKSDLILSMVPEGSHVRSVYLTPSTGVLASPNPPKILIDTSTIDPPTSLAIRSSTQKTHPSTTFYDAPVSGGVLGAQAGTLTFMLGASTSSPHLTLLTTLLGTMGANIFPCGGPSLGLTAKLCNNYCSGLIAIATSEAMDIGIKSGMDPRVLANIFHTSTAQSSILDDWCPVPGLSPNAPASKGYKGGFRVQLMRKDFGLGVEAAKAVGAELRLGAEGLRVYEEASEDERCRDLDSRVVFRFLGGDEEWRERFPEEVEMTKEETRRLIRLGKEKEREMKELEKGGDK